MADGLNKVCVLGNLGQDPELRVTSGGDSVLTLSVGCNESWLDKNRVRQERVEWVRCVVWGRRAEALSKFLRKGDKIFVEGAVYRTNSYDDREGVKRYSTQVIAKNVILGGSNNPRKKPEDPERRRPSRRDDDDEQPPVDQSAPSNGGGGGYDGGGDDDIPFAYVACPEREAWWRF